jgi:hypothetical protein
MIFIDTRNEWSLMSGYRDRFSVSPQNVATGSPYQADRSRKIEGICRFTRPHIHIYKRAFRGLQ